MNAILSGGIAAALAFAYSLIVPAVAQEAPAVLSTGTDAEHGTFLTDSEGMSLYLFEIDVQGAENAQAESMCYDACAAAWPPLFTTGEPTIGGEGLDAALLGTFTRTDGTTQVTYNGWPLYYYAEDVNAGDTNGHDIEANGGEWYLVTPEGERAED